VAKTKVKEKGEEWEKKKKRGGREGKSQLGSFHGFGTAGLTFDGELVECVLVKGGKSQKVGGDVWDRGDVVGFHLKHQNLSQDVVDQFLFGEVDQVSDVVWVSFVNERQVRQINTTFWHNFVRSSVCETEHEGENEGEREKGERVKEKD